MTTETEELTTAKRRLILRDSLSILSLLLGTAVLFAVTLFLFRSFTSHRTVLGQRWSDRGRAALQAGRPEEAITDLQTALSYAPGTRAYELLLAEALGDAGRGDESFNYFVGLWDSEPGNGFVNLELARLAAKRKDRRAAVNYYRAAIYGTWEGDGVERRAEARLELAGYLIATGDLPAARMELLIAGGNAPNNYNRDMSLAGLLQQAQDPGNAWTFYQKAIAMGKGDPAAQEAAGRLAYQVGDYENAYRLLEQAQAERAAGHISASASPDELSMLRDAARILELMPLASLPPRDRVAHILAAREIARRRFDTCAAQSGLSDDPSPLQTLRARWEGADGTSSSTAMLRDPALQDSAMQLIYDTEIQTEKSCGAPAGDDALLLKLATTSHTAATPNSAQGLFTHD